MVLNTPETTVPEPISMLTKPLMLVVGVCVSIYTAGPVIVPCKILNCIPTPWLVTKLFPASLITAW